MTTNPMLDIPQAHWLDIREELTTLEGWHASDLQPTSAEAARRRTLLRRSAALFPGTVGRTLVRLIRQYAPVEGDHADVLEVLAGNANEATYLDYQDVALMLSEGVSYSAIAEYMGLGRNTIADLAKWLGLDKSSRHDELTGHAYELLDTPTMDLTTEELMQLAGCTRKQAGRAIERARKWHAGDLAA